MMDVSGRNRSRLLVVIPDTIMDEVSIARRARILAESKGMDITFLGKVESNDTEPRLRRRLMTLSAIAGMGKSQSQYKTLSYPSWLDVLSMEFKPGDLILCPSRLTTSHTDLREEELLNNQYGKNMIFSTGIVQQEKSSNLEKLYKPILYWAGILIILGLSFVTESAFDNQVIGWIHIIGQIMVVLLEVMALYIWHRVSIRQRK
jgi:hypothetical protein